MSPKAATTWADVGCGLGIALSGAALVRALRPERSTLDIVVTAATPWLLMPSGALLAGSLLSRRRSVAFLAAGLVAYQAKCAGPWGRPAVSVGKDYDGPNLRVAFANVWRSNADVEGILAELAAGEHDVVGLAEVTDHHLGAIEAVFSPSRYPWRKVEPDGPDGSKGLALLSRFPIERVEKWWTQGHPQLDATVLVPGALPFRLLVVHTWAPSGTKSGIGGHSSSTSAGGLKASAPSSLATSMPPSSTAASLAWSGPGGAWSVLGLLGAGGPRGQRTGRGDLRCSGSTTSWRGRRSRSVRGGPGELGAATTAR